jgi:hypothetical protein
MYKPSLVQTGNGGTYTLTPIEAVFVDWNKVKNTETPKNFQLKTYCA